MLLANTCAIEHTHTLSVTCTRIYNMRICVRVVWQTMLWNAPSMLSSMEMPLLSSICEWISVCLHMQWGQFCYCVCVCVCKLVCYVVTDFHSNCVHFRYSTVHRYTSTSCADSSPLFVFTTNKSQNMSLIIHDNIVGRLQRFFDLFLFPFHTLRSCICVHCDTSVTTNVYSRRVRNVF